MTVIYVVLSAFSLLLSIGYGKLVRKKDPWMQVLFVCVLVVNGGYTALSASRSVPWALVFNGGVYLGSVFLSMCMFLVIYRLCGYTHDWRLPFTLAMAGLVMFAIVCTPLYYESVELTVVDGATKLIKDYGPLHNTYLVYLLGYFAAMVAVIIRSVRQRRIASHKHAVLMACIVLGNIAFWFVEKFVPWNFEFLSVSYLFSEVILIGLHWILQDDAKAVRTSPDVTATLMHRLPAGVSLNVREQEVLSAILANVPRKEIATAMNLSENTVKTHTRNLYKKLGVSNREELYASLQ